MDDGPAGGEVTGAAEVVAAGLTFTDATVEGSGGTWVNDPVRGVVFSTTEDDRLVGGTQGIDLGHGFTWSLWVKVAESNLDDPGADVIIGSRNGIWNKLQPTDLQRWADIRGFNLADDTWHHVALVGTTEPRVSLYIDGELEGSDSTFFNGATSVDDKFEFGGSSRFSEDITGLMSDIAVWDEALSEERIRGLASGDRVMMDAPFEVREVDFDPQTQGLTLVWDSSPGEEFAVRYSIDGQGWDGDLDDGIVADEGATTMREFDISGLAPDGTILFRVERNGG